MARFNPLIDRGHIASALIGGRTEYKDSRFALHGYAELENAWHSPLDGNFTQITLNERGIMQTVAEQRLELNAHFVFTGGDSTPRQRYAYLAGTGTIPTASTLALGGDRLFFVDGAYVIPVYGVNLPMLGRPSIAPRVLAGAAGVRRFGTPVTNVGGRVTAGLIQVGYLIDPHSHRWAFDGGITIPF